MSGQWVCIIIDFQVTKSTDAIKRIHQEALGIFGSDFIDMVIIDGDLMCGASDLEVFHYVFVKCRNFSAHIDKLRNSTIVSGVMDDYHRPRFVPEDEINEMRHRIRKPKLGSLFEGDVVIAQDGYLKGLSGIVVCADNGLYMVMFKFYTRSFVEELNREMLEHSGNIFDNMKFPVTLNRNRRIGDSR